MKLKAFDRVLLALLLIVAIVCSFVLFGVAIRLIPEAMALDFVALFYYPDLTNSLILAGCGLVLLFISIKLVFCGRGRKEVPPAMTLIRKSDIGGAYIAISAIDAMVQKHCRQQSKVRDCSTSLRVVDGGVAIHVKLSVMPDTDLVMLTEELQKSLKEYVESLSGVSIPQVGILVENFATAYPTANRVE